MPRSRQKSPRRSAPWSEERRAEKPLRRFPREGRFRLALGYANSYHIGMSSLALQRVYDLVHQRPDWVCERFFFDDGGPPRSVETATALGSFGVVAFTISFEEDYVHFLQMLSAAGIPLRRSQRGPRDPIVVVGGPCAAINPLTLADFVDVFALGAAENVLPRLLGVLEAESRPDQALELLADEAGFFVPAHHDTTAEGFAKLRKLELTEEQMRQPGHLPTTAIVTPHTEFANKFLIEMSRGCPEKCRYCWATFGMGRFRWHPTEFILEAIERARPVTDQLGFVATAVGDHPDLESILLGAHRQGFRTSVSSIRIPAVSEGVLEALHAAGDRSITLAPETGSDSLRVRLNKPIPNELLFDRVRAIFRAGFTQLKLYFIVGLPGESTEDVDAILEVGRVCREIMLEELAPRGIIGQIHLGTNILIPKPYTGYQREALEDVDSLRSKNRRLQKGVRNLPNVSLSTMSVRQAVWQTYLTKAGSDASELLEAAASGASVASLLREHPERVAAEVFHRMPGDLRWQFLRTG